MDSSISASITPDTADNSSGNESGSPEKLLETFTNQTEETFSNQTDSYSQQLCSLCAGISENVPATMVCKTDNLFLCNGCGRRHKASEPTNEHTILSLMEYSKINQISRSQFEKINESFICELCKAQNQKVQGYGFCKTCTESEILCYDCSNKHLASKMFRGHTINTDFSEFSKSNQISISPGIICELCKTQNQNVPGHGFCTTCPEPEVLCLDCSNKHSASKMFKGHIINTDLLKFHSLSKDHLIPDCELCKTQNQNVPGYGYCINCPEPEILCLDCSNKHLASKMFRGHTIETDLTDVLKIPPISALLCELCESQNAKVPGHGFCKTCPEPEILCLDCSKKHSASKMFRGHIFNTDLSEFFNPNQKNPPAFLCEQCEQRVPGYGFCNICPIPEILCVDCSEKHLASRWYPGHVINTNLSELLNLNSTQMFCEICEKENLKVPGYGYCRDCPGQNILCSDCAGKHTASVFRRHHLISTNLSELKRRNSSKFVQESNFAECSGKAHFQSSSSLLSNESFKRSKAKLECYNESNTSNLSIYGNDICSLCDEEGEQNPAKWFCKSCLVPELLCNSCARHHKREKLSSNHELCDNLNELQSHIEQNCILCSQCDHEEKTSIAVAYCLTCETKDPFCDHCASKHKWLKEFSDHDICRDMQSIPIPEKILCEQCRFQGKEKRATCFCSDCSNAEPLCDYCAKVHTGLKKYHNHKIDDLTKYQEKTQKVFCVLCELEGKQVNAVTKCIECNEQMCDNCSTEHSKHTANAHRFSDMAGGLAKPFKKNEHTDKPIENRQIPVPSDSLYMSSAEPQSIFNNNQNENRKQRPVAISKDFSVSSFSIQSSGDHQEMSIQTKTDQKETKRESQRSDNSVEETERSPAFVSCGQPVMSSSRFDALEIRWNAPTEGADYYIVSYKEKSKSWKDYEKQWKTNSAVIDGLSSDKAYQFKVCSIKGKISGKYSKVSETMKTAQSPAAQQKRYSILQKKGNPSVYKLPTKENKEVRNEKAKTRELIIGNPKNITAEKTLMLVGATGSGKSTLVDGIINYVLGVQFQDDFRFTMIELEDDEQKTQDQAQSQTEWVTVYKIIPEPSSRIGFTLNIIDTPGFGDTRGIKRDNIIIDQIRQLFSSSCQASVAFIDAVCFIAKAPDARLTAVQIYIFHQILSLFGKDMKDNFCNFITFADEQKPPVLSALKAAKLPAQVWFPFNNSGLFASNISNVAKPSWDMGHKSFKLFFEGLDNFQAKSLTQTKEVLQKREHLQTILSNLQPQINAGLSQINELGEQISIYEKHKNDVKNNKNFTYSTEIVKQVQIDLPQGVHVTNCLICNLTCHDRCIFADDRDKMRCSAMSKKGFCKICPKKCKWDQHRNAKYKFEYEIITEVRTYDDMKKKYEEAHGQTMSHEKYLLELQNDIENLFKTVKQMMNDMNDCKNELKKIALRPDPLSTVEHIEQLIQAEEIEKNPGYRNRIKMLQEYKNMAESEANVERISSELDNVREQVQNITSSDNKGFWEKIKSKFTEILQI